MLEEGGRGGKEPVLKPWTLSFALGGCYGTVPVYECDAGVSVLGEDTRQLCELHVECVMCSI